MQSSSDSSSTCVSEYGRIVVLKRNGQDSAAFELTDSTYVFGRAHDCDIRIQVESIGLQHCKLYRDVKGHVVVQNIDEAGTMVNEAKLTGAQETILRPGDVITVVERSFRYENPHFARLFPSFGVQSPGKVAAMPSTPVKGTPLREEVKAALDEIVPESAKLTPRRLQAQAATPVTAETFCVTPTKGLGEPKQPEATVSAFRVTPIKEAETPKAAVPATPLMPSKLGQSPINTLLGSAGSSAATPRLSSLSMAGTPRTPRATIPGSPTVVDHEIVASPKFSKGEVYEYAAAAPLTEDASLQEEVPCEPIVEAATEDVKLCMGEGPEESLIDAQEPMAEPIVTEVEAPSAAESAAEQMAEETAVKMEQVEERTEQMEERMEEANVVSTEPAAESAASAETEQQPIVTFPEAAADPQDDVQMTEAAPLEEVQEQKMEVVEEEQVETMSPGEQPEEPVAETAEAAPVMEEPQAAAEEASPNVEMTEAAPLAVEEAPSAPVVTEAMAKEQPEEAAAAPEEVPELVAVEAVEEDAKQEEAPTGEPLPVVEVVEEPAMPEACTLAPAEQSQEAPSMATEPTQEDLEAIAAIQAEDSTATPRRSSRRASASQFGSPASKATPSKQASNTATPVKAKATPLSKSTSAANLDAALEEREAGEECYVLAPAVEEAPTTASKRGRRASVAKTPVASSAKKASTRSSTRRGAAAKAEAEPESSASPSKNSHLAKTTSMSDAENDENQNSLSLPNDNEVDVTKAVGKKRGRPPTVHAAAASPATKNARSS